jgi:hydrogenase large subunit
MAQTIKIDPITRIEGHLGVEVEVEGGVVVNAKSMGMMFRGLELIMQNRDPRDAQQIMQRICGV